MLVDSSTTTPWIVRPAHGVTLAGKWAGWRTGTMFVIGNRPSKFHSQSKSTWWAAERHGRYLDASEIGCMVRWQWTKKNHNRMTSCCQIMSVIDWKDGTRWTLIDDMWHGFHALGRIINSIVGGRTQFLAFVSLLQLAVSRLAIHVSFSVHATSSVVTLLPQLTP